ncbi:MAG: TolC family protein [Opitutus sp.]
MIFHPRLERCACATGRPVAAGWIVMGLLAIMQGGELLAAEGTPRSQPAAVQDAAEGRSIPAPGTPWTLELALARAMEANPELTAARHEVERLEGVRLQVRAGLLPRVTASAGVNERAEGLVDQSPGQRLLPPSAETSVALYGYDLRIELRQVVFDGLKSWHELKRQDLLGRESFLRLRDTVVRTATLVRQAFDAIQMRKVLVAAEERRVEEFQQLIEWTSRKHAVGELAEFELLRAQAEFYGALAERAEARRALGESEQTFRRLLQMPGIEGRLQLEGEFVPRVFTLPLDEAVAQARIHRPDLQGAALAVEAARRNERAQTGRYLPRIEVFGSYGNRSSYYNSAVQLEGWTIGAAGQWSLFEGGAIRGQQISLRAERRAAESRLADFEYRISSQVRELYQGLEQSRVAMEAQERSVQLSMRASRDARLLYEAGQASLEQVLQAGMTHRRAESRFGEAVYNYNALVAEIEYAVGGQLGDSIAVPGTWKP